MTPKINYVCIGVQKAGTTSLINYMNQHPDVYMINDEASFFIEPDPDYFNNRKRNEDKINTHKKWIGAKSPSISCLKFAIDRLYIYNPNIKIILLLREPISRFYSQIQMYAKWRKSYFSETEILKIIESEQNCDFYNTQKEGPHYILRGYYDVIIEYLYSKFNKNNIYIGISEEILESKTDFYNKIFSFLGIKELCNIDENQDTHINTYCRNIPLNIFNILYKIYKPHIENCYKLLGREISQWENYYINIMYTTEKLSYHGLTFNYSYNPNDPSGLGCITEIIKNDEYKLHKYKNIKGNIIDIGGNNGLVTIILALQNPVANVYTLEPFSELTKIINKNVMDNNIKNVTLLEKGLGNGNVNTLYIGGLCTGASTINMTNVDIFKNKQQIQNIKSEAVQTITFDELVYKYNISNIELLKIDCEGGEYQLFDSVTVKQGIINNIVGEFHDLSYGEKRSKELTSYLKQFIKGDFNITYLNI